MRLLFCTRPAYGHVYPLMPLALAARDAGHEVRFATAGAFVPKLEALGFATHKVGLTVDEAVEELLGPLADRMPRAHDGRPDLETGARLFFDIIAPHTATDVAPCLDEVEPDLVVYEHMDFGAAIPAHAAGIPAVCHALSPRMPDEIVQSMAANRLDQLWAEHLASPGSFDALVGDLYLDIIPTVLQQPSFLGHPARRAMRPVPFAEPGAILPAWVGTSRRPLVYLTLGTIVATDEVLLPAIEGLATLDVDVLLALGSADGAELGQLPGNVHAEAFVDQAAVLRHADLVVHHGGSGTILGALTYGTPQVLLPKGADQFFNADAMAAAGLAPVLEPGQATADAVATMAKIELEDHRPAVDAVRDELAAMPHPAVVLEEVVATFG